VRRGGGGPSLPSKGPRGTEIRRKDAEPKGGSLNLYWGEKKKKTGGKTLPRGGGGEVSRGREKSLRTLRSKTEHPGGGGSVAEGKRGFSLPSSKGILGLEGGGEPK